MRVARPRAAQNRWDPHKSRPWLFAACCACFGVIILTTSPAAAAEQRFVRTVPIQADTPIHLEATIADVVVEGTARADLSLQIVRRAPHETDFARYPVLFEDRNGQIRVTAVQADGGVDPQLKTEIRLSVPSSAQIEALKVFEGKVRLTNLHGATNVLLRRGDIDAAGLSGRVRLETELGAIDVRGGELVAGGMMHLRTFNGDVRVRLVHKPPDARILAVTYNGTVTSDIPLTMKDRFGPHFGETTLGKGEPVLSIDIVKGNVQIKVG